MVWHGGPRDVIAVVWCKPLIDEILHANIIKSYPYIWSLIQLDPRLHAAPESKPSVGELSCQLGPELGDPKSRW